MAHDVFISVSSQDKPTGDAVCAVLENHGIRCWMAPRDIAPGAEWAESIIDAINDAHCMVLVFSARANASPQVRREVERAVNKGIPIIPLRIEDVQPSRALEYFISTPHWLDAFTPPLEQHLDRLARAIQIMLDRAGGSALREADAERQAEQARRREEAERVEQARLAEEKRKSAEALRHAEIERELEEALLERGGAPTGRKRTAGGGGSATRGGRESGAGPP